MFRRHFNTAGVRQLFEGLDFVGSFQRSCVRIEERSPVGRIRGVLLSPGSYLQANLATLFFQFARVHTIAFDGFLFAPHDCEIKYLSAVWNRVRMLCCGQSACGRGI